MAMYGDTDLQQYKLEAQLSLLALRQIRQFSNYELTVMTLKGETFAGFNARYRDSRFSILQLTFEVLYSQCTLVCRDNYRSK